MAERKRVVGLGVRNRGRLFTGGSHRPAHRRRGHHRHGRRRRGPDRDALRRIEAALQEAGATLSDVVRTRMFVTDITQWRDVGAVHAEVFGDIRPAATMVEVSALIDPAMLVEIEVDAYVPGD